MRSISNNKIFVCALTLVVIFSSGYALANVYELYVPYLVVFLSIIAATQLRYLKTSMSLWLCTVFCLGVVITYFVTGGTDFNSYLAQLFTVILSFQISQIYDRETILKFFIRVMTFIALVSLPFYFATNYLGVTLPIVNGHMRSYGNGLIFFYIVGRTIRNCGIFWEPSIFASFLSMAAMFTVFDKQLRHRKTRLLIFYIAVLTSNSSTGFVLLLLISILIICNYLFEKNHNILSVTMLSLFCSLLLVCIFLLWDQLILKLFPNNNFVLKLLSDNVQQSSRFVAILENLKLFLGRPVFGVGIHQFALWLNNVAYGDTATVFCLMAKFGLAGIAYLLLFIYSACKYRHYFFERILVFIILFIIANCSPQHTFLMTWIILFSLSNSNEEEQGMITPSSVEDVYPREV